MAENCYGNAFQPCSPWRPAALCLPRCSNSHNPPITLERQVWLNFLKPLAAAAEGWGRPWRHLMTGTGCQGRINGSPPFKNESVTAGLPPPARAATDFSDHLIDQGFIYLVRSLAPNLFPVQSRSTFIAGACWQSSVLWLFPPRPIRARREMERRH